MSQRRRNEQREQARRQRYLREGGLAVGFVVVLAGAAAWFIRDEEPPPEYRYAIVLDASPTNAVDRCEELAQLVRRALNATRDGNLQLTVSATTDRSRGNGLEHVYEVVRPRPPLSLKSAGSGARAAEADVETIEAARSACQGLVERLESPVFDAARYALSDLVAAECGANPLLTCWLVVRTDGLEERDPVLVKALRGEEADPAREARLSAPGVQVELCGLAKISVKARSEVPDFAVLQKAWAPELGAGGAIHATCGPL
jgi:hypothetical protein